MRILLIGEYSRLHNSLKEGLVALGHQVTLVSSGDGLKQFESDHLLISKIKQNKGLKFLNNISIRLFNKDFRQDQYAKQFKKLLPKLKNYDVVQLINEDAIGTTTKQSIKLFSKLFRQNSKIFLLSCGEDYTTINYFLNPKNGYSVLTPYLNNKKLSGQFSFSLKYITKDYKKLHDFISKNVNGIICSDLDYHRAFKNNPKYLGLIPNPVNTSLLDHQPTNIENNIHIFHGINSTSSIKKGADYFNKALAIIKTKYPNKVTITSTTDLPYKDYIKSYNQAHIILDQVYSYDQGYNALEAMYKGKVVFTGAEKEWLSLYNLEENTVAINALPDVDYLVKKLEWLINNPKQIETISVNAKAFIDTHHNYKNSAEQYLKAWNNS
ncbi:glycosyltransferase [Olleya sp. R77988]|uniref:glycosyltransferase n=1 Tax=Olleya sp. R77988 TaxID=3093875 RepID=UPI0037C7E3D3